MAIKSSFVVLALSLFNISLAQALPEDRQQPIDVVADNATMDETSGVTVLTGNVKIVQGTMLITSAKLDISRDENGDISKMVATGKPAYFQQIQQKGQPLTKAYGSTMVYLVTNQTVTITGNARVEQQKDKFTGEKVIYHMDKAIVNAIGGKQRVKMIIQPKGQK